MQTHHTPGPWAIRENDRAIVPAADPRRLVAHGGSILPDDARLIAAAPDLLAALRDARSMVYQMTGDSAICAPWNALLPHLDAAIARATGQ